MLPPQTSPAELDSPRGLESAAPAARRSALHLTREAFSSALIFPMQPDGLSEGESGQARLRFIGVMFTIVIFILCHLSGVFGDLMLAVKGLVVYALFSYVWGWCVAVDLWGEEKRRVVVIVLDQIAFSFGMWYSEGQLAILSWMPIFMALGNGLRFGVKLAAFSSIVGSSLAALAFIMSPYWHAYPGVAAGVVMGILIVPWYAVSLNLRQQVRQRQAELRAAQLEDANRTDPLTGQLNRVGFTRALKRLVDDATDFGATGVVFYIDLDGFKPVNDIAGHEAGDKVLVQVGRALKESIRSNDVVGRLGGDEFAIVARGVVHPDDAYGIAEKIFAAMKTVRVHGHPELKIGATLGACLLPDPTMRSAEDVLRAADEAMLAAKRVQKGTLRVHVSAKERASAPAPLDSQSHQPPTAA